MADREEYKSKYTGEQIDEAVGNAMSSSDSKLTQLSTSVDSLETEVSQHDSTIDRLVTQTDSMSKTLQNHVQNKSNPHNVTKAQVGLDNVDNTSDENKPVSIATQIELSKKANLTDDNRFTGNNYFSEDINVSKSETSSTTYSDGKIINNPNEEDSYLINLPTKNGTLALTSDIGSGDVVTFDYYLNDKTNIERLLSNITITNSKIEDKVSLTNLNVTDLRSDIESAVEQNKKVIINFTTPEVSQGSSANMSLKFSSFLTRIEALSNTLNLMFFSSGYINLIKGYLIVEINTNDTFITLAFIPAYPAIDDSNYAKTNIGNTFHGINTFDGVTLTTSLNASKASSVNLMDKLKIGSNDADNCIKLVDETRLQATMYVDDGSYLEINSGGDVVFNEGSKVILSDIRKSIQFNYSGSVDANSMENLTITSLNKRDIAIVSIYPNNDTIMVSAPYWNGVNYVIAVYNHGGSAISDLSLTIEYYELG